MALHRWEDGYVVELALTNLGYRLWVVLVVMWLCGYVVMWLCGCAVVRLGACFAKCAGVLCLEFVGPATLNSAADVNEFAGYWSLFC